MKTLNEKTKSTVYITLAAAGLFVFLLMLFMLTKGSAHYLDDPVRQAFYSLRTPALNAFASKFTLLGNWESIVALCIIMLIPGSVRKIYGLPLAAGSIATTIMNKLIKISVARPRPEDVAHLVDAGGFSFTSGHSVASMFVFGLLLILVRKNVRNSSLKNVLTPLLFVLMFGIGLSRIYLGVHYPTDVIGGWGLGFCFIMLTLLVTDLCKQR